MERANVLLALGGDQGNTVAKLVTAAEIVVLRAIHGDEAVFDIAPAEAVSVNMRAEHQRLRETYTSRDNDNKPIIDSVFPGAAPVLPMTLDDLDLPESLFAALRRATPEALRRGGRPPKKAAKAAKPADDADDADDALDDIEAEPETDDKKSILD